MMERTLRIEMEFGDVFPDRPMPAGRLFVPEGIALDGEFLTWPWVRAGEEKQLTYRQAKPGMLTDFMRLHDATDEGILTYARRWGVLGLCEHGLPCSHNQYPDGLLHGVRPCLPMLATSPRNAESDIRLKEPVAAWRMWSRKAQSLINIGARLNQGKLARVEDWQTLKELRDFGLGATESEPFMANVANARAELGDTLDGWISIGQVRPRISWQKDKARFSLDAVSSGPNLFGILALNIAVAIAAGDGEKGLAICSACGLSYIPARRPDPNRSNYCKACGLKAAQRDASRRYRKTAKNKSPRKKGRR
jgi:hypothetical protein